MNTTTQKELNSKFEGQKYTTINYPEMDENEPIYMRSEISKIHHFNTVYRDGKKVYIEDHADACGRLVKRVFGKDYEYDIYDLEKAEHCLYLSGYVFKEAKRIFMERYV